MARRTKQCAEEAFRELVQRFIRDFGLLNDAQTPCGQPLKTSWAHTLMILLSAGDDGMHQAALARSLRLDKSNVSRLVQQLSDKGHVAVSSSPDEDARIKRVRLTAKGTRLATQVDQASRTRFAELFASITPAGQKRALAGLEELLSALERSRLNEKEQE